MHEENESLPPSGVNESSSTPEFSPALEQASSEPAVSPDEIQSSGSELSPTPESQAELEADHPEMEVPEQEVPAETYRHYSAEDFLKKSAEFLAAEDIAPINEHIRVLRESFREFMKGQKNEALARFLEDDTKQQEDFAFQPGPMLQEIQTIFQKLDERRAELKRRREKEQQKNTELKKEILSQLKEIVEGLDSGTSEFTKSKGYFDQVHALQERWRGIGAVDPAEAKELGQSYHFYKDKFYDFVRMIKQFRELDAKKNLEIKNQLIAKAEALGQEEDVRKAMESYRQLLKQWKETGLVAKEISDATWEKFRLAGDVIYAKFKGQTEESQARMQESMAQKTVLLQRMREFNALDMPTSHAAWQKLNENIEALMEEWKKAGFGPKKENEEIWQEFRAEREKFYNAKENYYEQQKKMMQENLRIKNDLITQAEALRESTEWKKSADKLKQLQETWKKTGPVPFKHTEKMWARFRAACDAFFENRKAHFSEKDNAQEENLKIKQEMLLQVEAYVPNADPGITVEQLKKFQDDWFAVGMVPFKEKDTVNKAFKKAIDRHFDNLRSNRSEQHKQYHSQRYESMLSGPGAKDKANEEIFHLQERIRRKESEAALLDNNLGFFAKSKNADELKKDTEKKIALLREDIRKMKEQMKLIREMMKPKEEKPS